MKLATKLTILAISLTTSMSAWAEGQHYVGVGLGALNIGNGISKKACSAVISSLAMISVNIWGQRSALVQPAVPVAVRREQPKNGSILWPTT